MRRVEKALFCACIAATTACGGASAEGDTFPEVALCTEWTPLEKPFGVLFDTIVFRVDQTAVTRSPLPDVGVVHDMACDRWREALAFAATRGGLEVVARPRIVALPGRTTVLRVGEPFEQVTLRADPNDPRQVMVRGASRVPTIVSSHWAIGGPQSKTFAFGTTRPVALSRER